jgi:hypothetical protein
MTVKTSAKIGVKMLSAIILTTSLYILAAFARAQP